MKIPKAKEKTKTDEVQYRYVIECKQPENSIIILDVAQDDIILNADGEMDCPLDTVLRKNNYTIDDLTKHQCDQAHFVRAAGSERIILRTISLNSEFY